MPHSPVSKAVVVIITFIHAGARSHLGYSTAVFLKPAYRTSPGSRIYVASAGMGLGERTMPRRRWAERDGLQNT